MATRDVVLTWEKSESVLFTFYSRIVIVNVGNGIILYYFAEVERSDRFMRMSCSERVLRTMVVSREI